MIAYDWLDSISHRLQAFRESGLIIQDSRDKGNYFDSRPTGFFEVLKRRDPTGLAMGLLLSQMIESTTSCSMVKLERVLREEGYLDQLRQLTAMHDELASQVSGPAHRFAEQVNKQISKLSNTFGMPSDREVAICLRDAIYAIDKGMSLNWLEHTGSSPVRAPLQNRILTYPTLAQFIHALKTELGTGVYLANVDNCTAIGFVAPGRIAYLSSISVSHHTGQIIQNRSQNSHMAEALDLDTPVERYPHWGSFGKGDGLPASLSIADQLTRDQVIWLAMLVELTHQEMESLDREQLQLTEGLAAAIGYAGSSTLPVKYQPNWKMDLPTKQELLDRLELTPWELGFVSEFIDQIPVETLIPIADGARALMKSDLSLKRWPDEYDTTYTYFESQDIKKNAVCFKAISEGVAGTEAEMRELMLKVGSKNLFEWIIERGNEKFLALWEEKKKWFEDRLRKNLDHALTCGLGVRSDFKDHPMAGAIIYTQSPKHKGFKALCAIDGKSPADTVVRFKPRNSQELVQLLNFKNEKALPEELQGWVQVLGWRSESGASRPEKAPNSTSRWVFGRTNVHNRYLNAVILCSKANLPTD